MTVLEKTELLIRANSVGLTIEGIGKANLETSVHYFELLKDAGIKTHYVGADVEMLHGSAPCDSVWTRIRSNLSFSCNRKFHPQIWRIYRRRNSS